MFGIYVHTSVKLQGSRITLPIVYVIRCLIPGVLYTKKNIQQPYDFFFFEMTNEMIMS